MSDHGDDLDDIHRGLPAPNWAAIHRDMQRARSAAETHVDPPSIIPAPEVLPGCVARFHCPRGCGWHHDESTDPGPSALRLPADFTAEDLAGTLTLNAEARGLVVLARIEQALTKHYDQMHR